MERTTSLSDDPDPPSRAVEPADTLTTQHESPLQAISNAMAQIYKAQFGRGPTKVKTFFAGPDAVVCVLEDTQTPAERRLVELGEHQRLRDVRSFYQHATEDAMRGPVEEATGRSVRAFVSGIDVRADAAVETFLLGD
ncbi:Na-translocating system protein MpsC family protein [Patulibacter minatonensis]|uniref:Na-translocating system protein MpsC family protein n=1 Tax=Patulibacter minatonensis TaxID=298163 RepID=UPI0004795244|nr:Na-translocating system protein MpsC family protein [Patulibacter minatonensis]